MLENFSRNIKKELPNQVMDPAHLASGTVCYLHEQGLGHEQGMDQRRGRKYFEEKKNKMVSYPSKPPVQFYSTK